MPATVSGSEITLRFSYKPAIVAAVKDIPGRSWDDKGRVWTLPATPWHARQVIDKLSDHITVELDVKKLAGKDKLDLLHADDDLIEDLSVEGYAPYPYQAAVVPVLDQWKGRALIADEVGCIDGDAEIIVNRSGRGGRYTMRQLYQKFNGLEKHPRHQWDLEIPTMTRSVNPLNKELRLNEIKQVVFSGIKDCVKVTLASGKSLILTPDHEIFTPV
jgi:hypothetical protein